MSKLSKSEKFTLIPYYYGFLLILLINGSIFLKSGYGKVSEGKFVGGLSETLTKFAGKNPYPWYKDFLNGFVIPNSQSFGFLIMWGELLSGFAIISSIFCLLFRIGRPKIIFSILAFGLIGGFLLSLNFYLAAGWTSPSTDSLNFLMGLIQLIALAETIKLLRQT